jgi:anti-sigma factor RsiW
MSHHHLGDRLSALVDGELNGAERDRAHAHLAGCEQCRADAAGLRELKRQLRGLPPGAPAEEAITRRLIAMTGPGGPLPPRRGPHHLTSAGTGLEPFGLAKRTARRRYAAIGALSVVVGLGAVAFGVGGGGEAVPGPRVTPQVEMYSVQHAITTGEVPYSGPSGRPAAVPSDDSVVTHP